MKFYTRPLATQAILMLFAFVFIAQQVFTILPNQGFLESHITTLLALGGLNNFIVTKTGQYYRLLTAAFLHGGLLHLLFNGYAFFIAASFLENHIGRLYMLFIFMVGIIGSSLVSFYYNDPLVTSVGASGGIMSLFGCMLVIAWLLIPPGELRSRILAISFQVAIMGLLPILSLFGLHIDYAGHFGGFAVGAFITLIACRFPFNTRRSGVRAVALLVTSTLFAGLAYGFFDLCLQYDTFKGSLFS